MQEEVAGAGVCNQFLFPGGPIQSTSLWTRPPWPTSSATSFSSQEEGGVLNSRPRLHGGGARRSSLLGKEGSEDDGGEGKLGGEGGEKGEESNP